MERNACLIERIKATYINYWCQIIIKRVADSVANASLLLPVQKPDSKWIFTIKLTSYFTKLGFGGKKRAPESVRETG